jgi:hypothetical protein
MGFTALLTVNILYLTVDEKAIPFSWLQCYVGPEDEEATDIEAGSLSEYCADDLR